MFTSTFSSNITSWLPDQFLNMLRENDGEQKINDVDNTIVLTVSPPMPRRRPPPKKVIERRNYRNNPSSRGQLSYKGDESHNRSLSPIGSPKPTRCRRRSLSQTHH